MPGAASVPRREISLPRGKHDREKHRKNCVPALRDPGIRGNSGRLVTSGDKYGTLVTAIDLTLDHATRDVISARADNVIVRTGAYAKDPEQTALIESYDKVAAQLANRPAGSITETLARTPNDAGESVLGDIVADAQLAATRADKDGGAVIA